MLLHTLQFYNFVGRLFTSPIETCMTKNTSLTSIQIDQTVISVVILIKATSQGKIYLDSIVSSRIGVFIIVHENALARLSPPSDTNFTTDKQPTKTWNVKRKRTTDYVKLTSQPSEVSLVAKVPQKSQLCCHKFGVKSWNLSPILPVIYLTAVFSLQGAPSTEKTGIDCCPVLLRDTSKSVWDRRATRTISELFVMVLFPSILVCIFF